MSTRDEEISDIKREINEIKLRKLRELEEKALLVQRLPHRHLHKLYLWQDEFIKCQEKIQIVTAANQIGKSSTMIKKNIEWGTNEELWPELWPEATKNGQRPTQFCYLYPSKDIVTAEFYDKWIPLLPPEKDPEYGWKAITFAKHIHGIQFHNGVMISFKTYRQGEDLLQAGTYWMVTCDEELPVELLPELQARVTATDGYMVFGFTATIGQDFWKQVVEDRIKMPDAWVRQISLFDCQKYMDGSPSRWTPQRIQQVIDNCTTPAEVARRVHGKFVKDEGLRFPTFDTLKHLKPYHKIPDGWDVYCGVDWGSGGKNHPSSIVFVAANQDRTKFRLIRCWRGDDEDTTQQDVVNQYCRMAIGLEKRIVAVFYDFAAADLGTIAVRQGLPFQRANKSRTEGVNTINTLFKLDALVLYEMEKDSKEVEPDHLQTYKLVQELLTIDVDTSKKDRHIRDDCVDALRYALFSIGINWAAMPGIPTTLMKQGVELKMYKVDPRTGEVINDQEEIIQDEIEFWNDHMEGF